MEEKRIKNQTYLLTVVTLILFIIFFGFLFWTLEAMSKTPYPILDVSTPEISVISDLKKEGIVPPSSDLKKEISVEDQIRKIAIENNFDPETAIRISLCESGLDYKAKNKNSSASGLYQFVSKTWENYCEGNIFDIEDNTLCFVKLYPKHPHWWVCK